MNITRLERRELDLKHKRYRIFRLDYFSARSFKIFQWLFCKFTISFLTPSSSSHHGKGRRRGRRVGRRRGARAVGGQGGGARGGAGGREREAAHMGKQRNSMDNNGKGHRRRRSSAELRRKSSIGDRDGNGYIPVGQYHPYPYPSKKLYSSGYPYIRAGIKSYPYPYPRGYFYPSGNPYPLGKS
jgi:hypothetical protein